ncbi:MAG: thioredoxin domain-containing protein [Bacteroidetes bacterium]|nr:thioredoxin domain-containing protein [Bacteroidota bacterium]
MNLRISLFPLLLVGLMLVQSDQDVTVSTVSTDECAFTKEIPEVKDFMKLVTISDPFQGNMSSKVTVIEYFDPNCPHCKTLHPIMKNVIAANRKSARFYMVPFVLWPYSVPQAEALFVAAGEGKYFEMLDAQYDHQKSGGLSVTELTNLAKDIGLDAVKFKSQMEKGQYRAGILARRQEISDLGVRGTPALMINGKFVDGGSKSLACINELIKKEAARLKQG